MRITHKVTWQERFSDLEAGQWFRHNSGGIWRKTIALKGTDGRDINAVAGVDGVVGFINPDQLVTPLDAELVIHGPVKAGG